MITNIAPPQVFSRLNASSRFGDASGASVGQTIVGRSGAKSTHVVLETFTKGTNEASISNHPESGDPSAWLDRDGKTKFKGVMAQSNRNGEVTFFSENELKDHYDIQ